MKSRVAILLAVFCIGAALFFLRHGTDPVVKKKPPGPPSAVPRVAPSGTKLTPAQGAEQETTPTPSPTPSVFTDGQR